MIAFSLMLQLSHSALNTTCSMHCVWVVYFLLFCINEPFLQQTSNRRQFTEMCGNVGAGTCTGWSENPITHGWEWDQWFQKGFFLRRNHLFSKQAFHRPGFQAQETCRTILEIAMGLVCNARTFHWKWQLHINYNKRKKSGRFSLTDQL